MSDDIFATLFFAWPILLGLVIWLAKPKVALDIVERWDQALLIFRSKAEAADGRVAKYWRRPASKILTIPVRSTTRIKEPFLRCGVRVALYPYAVALVAVGTLIALELLMVFGCFIAIFLVWGLFERLARGQAPGAGDRLSKRHERSEGQCPDCDSVKISPFLNQGDGRCSVCHGTGQGGMLDQFVDATNPLGRQGTTCFKCHGTGQCQTCGGKGVVYM